ncbi:hypothetical protein GCM10022409_48160 [Hymenobacter glaciei]|uniref:Uncharacterized protein n=1 Tax=Hymenobacter glaciei TaxID=877209 RepID=A0ABP7UY13_9BACT
MRDSEMAAPRIWPVVLAQALIGTGAALFQEVPAAVSLLPGQVARTRRVRVAGRVVKRHWTATVKWPWPSRPHSLPVAAVTGKPGNGEG